MSRLQTPVRKNDTVVVVGGKDRGKRGRVLRVIPDRNRVIVEGGEVAFYEIAGGFFGHGDSGKN